jgi:3-isopropylmalate/(R)-2-methylmalate dehydratase small subunit
MMKPFTHTTGVAVPFLDDDVNTDQIAPVQAKRALKPDYRELFFYRARRAGDDTLDAGYVLNQPRYQNPAIFVAGRNFGCGSSREAAVWTMQAAGVQCLIARSIADLYRENCLQNGLLPIELSDQKMDGLAQQVIAADGAAPFTVDLRTCEIIGPGGYTLAFDIPAADRIRLLEGLDDIGMSLKHLDAIAEWEKRAREHHGWLQKAARDPSTEPRR